MAKIYTEIRLPHKSIEEKKEYENKLDEAVKKNGYSSRVEFIREKIRELVRNTKQVKHYKDK